MRKPVIAGNWKMFKTIGESVNTAVELKPLVANANHCEVVIAPVFTALKSVADRLEGSNINVSAQDVSDQLKHGAHTGEICGDMLKDAGCSHVIIGHSERRSMYGDTDDFINRKLRAALQFGLTPILCCGETLDERDAGNAEKVVNDQLEADLRGFASEEVAKMIIAYEPVWAIGTGRTATPAQAQQMHAFIRVRLKEKFGAAISDQLRVLYGGSVKPENIAELMNEADIDGALVGGASLDAESFARIVNYNQSL
ncbi:MAG TPA: triose-phosphate isomerase [Blastocatellia bacterium]|nr:triose-phosphate isomerase [Blastocatellia bacterium]